MFGALLMPLKEFKASLQQALEFGISGRRDKRNLKRAAHRQVISDLIGKVSPVEFRAFELRQFSAFAGRLFG